MIKSFRHKGLKKLFEVENRSGVRTDQVERTENILSMLAVAELEIPISKDCEP